MKNDWLWAGCELLRDGGQKALTIENLCQKQELTKGAFYHHFKNMPEYHTALLQYYQQQSTLSIIEQLQHLPTATQQLKHLLNQITDYAPQLEIAFRAWAMQDTQVAKVQEAIDLARVAYVESLLASILDEEAQLKACTLYWMFVGSQHSLLGLSSEAKKNVFNHYLQLIGIA